MSRVAVSTSNPCGEIVLRRASRLNATIIGGKFRVTGVPQLGLRTNVQNAPEWVYDFDELIKSANVPLGRYADWLLCHIFERMVRDDEERRAYMTVIAMWVQQFHDDHQSWYGRPHWDVESVELFRTLAIGNYFSEAVDAGADGR